MWRNALAKLKRKYQKIYIAAYSLWSRLLFNSDKLTGVARYVRVKLVDAVLWNNPTNWYTPQLGEVKVFGYKTPTESVPPTAPTNLIATTV